MKREGDKIIFDSESQRQKIENFLSISDDEFYLQILMLMARSRKEANNIWKWLEKELKGQLRPDETLVYRHDIEEMRVVKTTQKAYPERSTPDEGEES